MSASGADHYFALIEATLGEALGGVRDLTAIDGDDFPLEAVLPLLAGRTVSDAVVDAFESSRRVVDGGGQSRVTYPALAARALARHSTFSLQRFHEVNACRIHALAGTADAALPLAASRSDAAIAAAFAVWATKDVDPLLARRALYRVASEQQPDGTFLARTDADAPEPRWYDELALLHALSCYASETGDAIIEEAVARAVKYHAAETQPDHASTHPWAIAAFLSEPDAIPLADMMLHAAGVQSPRTMDAVSLLLLSDALDCGRRRATR